MLLFSQSKTEQEHEKQIDNIVKKERQKRKKMAKLGIDYDFPGYVSVVTFLFDFESSPSTFFTEKRKEKLACLVFFYYHQC